MLPRTIVNPTRVRLFTRAFATREAPTVLGAREPPMVDKTGWLQRKKQKLRDLTDYDKAFAAHAAERRHL